MKKIFEVEISDLQVEMLICLESDSSYCKGYDELEEATGMGFVGAKKLLQNEIKFLRTIGLVEYVRGCMNDDNEVTGSGFCRTKKGNEFVEKYNL